MISIQSLLGKGYKPLYDFRGRYACIKGSRGSKKSCNISIIFFLLLTKFPDANLLVIRKTYRSLKDSCYAQLKWACNKLGLDYEWSFKENPLEIVNKRTKQKIYFRGLDDPLKITSITADIGTLCWVWIEEAYEVTNESDFDTIDESVRGTVPEGLWKMIVLSFNPWNERHWLKHKFFDEIVGFDSMDTPIYKERPTKEICEGSYVSYSPDGMTMAMTTNYKCNEFLDENDLKVFENMRLNNPRRYQVAGLGNFGVVEGLVYDNFTEKEFTLRDVRNLKTIAGMDFGYTNDPTAIVIGFIDKDHKLIYIWDELYEKGLSNRDICRRITEMGYAKEHFICDSAEPKSIDELKYLGLRCRPAKKGRDSIRNGIQFIQNYKIIIHPRCTNFLTEINNYAWAKDRFGKLTNEPIDDFNHLMDACLEENTIVNTPNGRLAIKELVGKSGEIYAYDTVNKKVVISEFKNCRATKEVEELYEIELENGEIFRCTYDHKILTHNRGYVKACELNEDDDIVFMDTLRYNNGMNKYIIFNGLKYVRDDHTGYYLNSTTRKRLHRSVWEFYNGEIPKGYDIHHIDHNKANNDISNLLLISEKEHMKLHQKEATEETLNKKRKNIKENALPKACEWHKSTVAKEWHKKHYEEMKDKLYIKIPSQCLNCGKEIMILPNHGKFCSNKCKSAYRRSMHTDDEERICKYCGKKYSVSKYRKQITCGRSCANRIRYENKKNNEAKS